MEGQGGNRRSDRVPRAGGADPGAADSDDLARMTVPALVMHGNDDQIVPARTRPRFRPSASRVEGSLRIANGRPAAQSETINADLLAFIQS